MIIDIHTHTFPDAIADKSIRSMERMILEAQNLHVKAPNLGTYDDLSRSCKANGIDVAMVAPVATKPSQTAKINTLSKEYNSRTIVGENGTHVFYMGAIHPDCEDYKEIIDFVADNDMKAIKIHPDYQSTFIDDDRYVRIMDYADKKDLAILVHAGEDIGLPNPIHCTPNRVLNVLSKINPKKLILAHMAGWNMWDEVYEKLCGLPLYMDTAVCLKRESPHLEYDQFVRMIRKHGADRVFFGTDYPWDNAKVALEDIKKCGLTVEELELILGKNAEKMFGSFA